MTNELLDKVTELTCKIEELKKENEELHKKCENLEYEAKVEREKRLELAERCIRWYVEKNCINSDRIRVEVVVPYFMSAEQVREALTQIVIDEIVIEKDKRDLRRRTNF